MRAHRFASDSAAPEPRLEKSSSAEDGNSLPIRRAQSARADGIRSITLETAGKLSKSSHGGIRAFFSPRKKHSHITIEKRHLPTLEGYDMPVHLMIEYLHEQQRIKRYTSNDIVENLLKFFPNFPKKMMKCLLQREAYSMEPVVWKMLDYGWELDKSALRDIVLQSNVHFTTEYYHGIPGSDTVNVMQSCKPLSYLTVYEYVGKIGNYKVFYKDKHGTIKGMVIDGPTVKPELLNVIGLQTPVPRRDTRLVCLKCRTGTPCLMNEGTIEAELEHETKEIDYPIYIPKHSK